MVPSRLLLMVVARIIVTAVITTLDLDMEYQQSTMEEEKHSTNKPTQPSFHHHHSTCTRFVLIGLRSRVVKSVKRNVVWRNVVPCLLPIRIVVGRSRRRSVLRIVLLVWRLSCIRMMNQVVVVVAAVLLVPKPSFMHRHRTYPSCVLQQHLKLQGDLIIVRMSVGLLAAAFLTCLIAIWQMIDTVKIIKICVRVWRKVGGGVDMLLHLLRRQQHRHQVGRRHPIKTLQLPMRS
mmetsp:Transcript_30435/g.61057  ORF Transcript_30435/g.61057 Transcript_30435/m.61057 type:complete len:233 (-) Transcript_30435:4604-5302(-)